MPPKVLSISESVCLRKGQSVCVCVCVCVTSTPTVIIPEISKYHPH